MALLREVCQMQQYDALSAATGRTALTLAASAKPDLVLLDWDLPDTTGIEICRELRRSGVSVPIVMLTGHDRDSDIVTGLEEGVDEYLTKPIRPKILAARLAAHLRRASAEADKLRENAAPHLAVLNRVAFFLDHPPASLRVLAKKAVMVHVRGGSAVLAQGSSNDSLFVVQKGSVEVALTEPGGNTIPVTRLGEAEFFGAISLMTAGPAPVTVTAVEDSELVKISRDDLLAELVAGSHARGQFEAMVKQRQELLRGLHDRITPAARTARLTSVYSPNGGVGKTTLALNLAASLARTHRGRVLLVDLSLPYNHAAQLAHLAPSTSLARLADIDNGFDHQLQGALVPHPAGFVLLSSALAPEEADLITPTLVSRALAVLKPQFDSLVFDLGVELSEVALAVLEQSQAVFVIAAPDGLLIRDLSSVFNILHNVLGLADGQTHLVINHRSADATVGRAEIENQLGVKTAMEISHDGRRPEQAALKGELLALSASNSPIGRAAAGLARLVD